MIGGARPENGRSPKLTGAEEREWHLPAGGSASDLAGNRLITVNAAQPSLSSYGIARKVAKLEQTDRTAATPEDRAGAWAG
jgi:hypothetical protein